METPTSESSRPEPQAPSALLLPIGMVTSLGLGLAVLDRSVAPGFGGWLQVAAGSSLCLVSGWMASAIASRTYWNQSMARQVAVWRRITDAFFAWVEDIQVSTEALNQLKVSLEEAVPSETA